MRIPTDSTLGTAQPLRRQSEYPLTGGAPGHKCLLCASRHALGHLPPVGSVQQLREICSPGAVRRHQLHSVQLFGGHPLERRVHAGLWLTGKQSTCVGPQHPTIKKGHVDTKPLLHPDVHAELLVEFAPQRLRGRLAGVDAAPRQLPEPRQRYRPQTSGQQHPAPAHDGTGNYFFPNGQHRGSLAPRSRQAQSGGACQHRDVTALLEASEIESALEHLPGWIYADARLSTTAELASFRVALNVVAAVGDAAEERDHHPDIDIRWRTVTFTCTTHSAGGVTAQDVELATEISRLIAAA